MIARYCASIVFGCFVSSALALDIEGVQPAALDQPRVNIHFRRTATGEPLTAHADAEKTINVEAFLDTGASGILLSGKSAEALGVKPLAATFSGKQAPVRFTDIGVAGGDTFGVSEKLFVFIAPYTSKGEPGAASEYPLRAGPVRVQLAAGGGIMEMLTGGIDVLGMPAMVGRVAVIDPKPVDTFGDTLRTGVFEKGKGTIPKTDRHVKLSYANFKRFTRLTPKTAEWPTMADNPMIGPNPVAGKDAAAAPAASAVPPVTAIMNGNKIKGSWLLDTGAVSSMISTANAARLGVHYAPGTEGTEAPRLANIPEKDQFSLSVGGIGGMKKCVGFFLDQLIIPTTENDPFVFKRAPVLICDISVDDAVTKEKYTLDGVFGMNYLVASAFVTESALLPDLKNMTPSAFSWIVFDQPQAILGLKLKEQK